MKIVTNIQFYAVGGIAQYLSTLIQYNEEKPSARIYGIDVLPADAFQDAPQFDLSAMRHFTLRTCRIEYPTISQALERAASLDDMRRAYRPVIDAYYEYLREVQPDCIIVNGTYAMPWCLLQAARRFGKADLVIHYHGVLTKETEHWKDERTKAIMDAMEREFDVPRALYIFPSQIARNTVEGLVFKHPLKNAVVVPNPVPDHFFTAARPKRRLADSIGMVARWSKVKNIDFLISLARYSKKKQQHYSFPLITNLSADHKEYRRALSVLDVQKPVPHHKLPAFYKRLGVLLLPSRFETYGNVAQEALAVGTPVLVSVAAGVAETFHLIGLSEWVHDFSSTAQVFEAAAHMAASTVPAHARSMLQLSFSTASVFKTYFKVLRDWC